MDPVRIAAVGYLNTAPLVEGLEGVAGLRLERTVPSRIADAITAGEADVGLVSVVDLVAGDPPRLTALSCGMIGCHGTTLTVRVFSAIDPAAIRVLHADTDSHTSVVLAQLMIAERAGRLPDIAPFDARERSGAGNDGWPEALLLIGDKVVVDAPPAVRYPHQIDLGEAWRTATGLPFVYAFWACRAGEEHTGRVRTAAALIDRQRRRNAMRIDAIASLHAERLGWPDDLARRYLGELLRYELTDDARAGADRFLDMAGAAGLLGGGRARWASSPRHG